MVNDLLRKHNSKVTSFFNQENEYVVQSIKDSNAKIKFDSASAFIFHNATTAMKNLTKKSTTIMDTLNLLNKGDTSFFYKKLQKNVNSNLRERINIILIIFPKRIFFHL